MSEARYVTRISAHGPGGNIFEILGKARVFARQLDVPAREIDAFSKRVMAAKSYSDALAVVREWFPVDTDEDPGSTLPMAAETA